MIKINLNPKVEKKRAKKPKALPSIKVNKLFLVVIILIALIVAEVGYYILLGNKESDLLSKKQYLQSEKNRLKVIEAKVRKKKELLKSAKKLKENLELRKKIFLVLSKQKSDFVPVLNNLGNSLIDGIWLKEIKLSRSQNSFKGFSFNPMYISSFYKNLNKYFQQVSLNNIKRIATKADLTYYNFKIKTSSWKINKKEGLNGNE